MGSARAKASHDHFVANSERSTQSIASRVDRRIMHGGPLHVSPSSLHIGSWNVEGLSDDKILVLQEYMDMHGIDIICLQETPCADRL